jgi:hypothetical protein
MLTICHKEFKRQRSNIMVMAIINLKKHEKTTIHTIYECKWTHALGFNCVTHCRKPWPWARDQGKRCRNPTLAKCGGEAQHLERVGIWSPPGLPNVESSTARGKTPCIGVFLVSLKRSWNVDTENGLALIIRTSAAQVMGKRRAGSQTGSLTPDH